MQRFSAKVIEQLKWYVYLYTDPRDDEVFYVGKGTGNRAFAHLRAQRSSDKSDRLAELSKLGVTPRIEVLKYGLTEEQAYIVEGAVIDLLGVESLTNAVRGHWSRYGNRDEVGEVAALLDAPEADFAHPCILININRSYRPGMTPQQLYDLTRSAWRVGKQRRLADYAMSVYRGVVREVYRIAAWVPDGTTLRWIDSGHRKKEVEAVRDRWEFVGTVAEEAVRQSYVGKSVKEYFPQGSQNPIRYVGVSPTECEL